MNWSQKIQHCSIVILAAGTSKRLGEPKQLLKYNGRNLLQHTIETARASVIKNIIVVLGAAHDKIQKELTAHNIDITYNAEWKEGIASSIRKGIETTVEIYPETDGIIFMVCDQPFVNADLLNKLLKSQQENGSSIVASRYREVSGTPALFHSSLFAELMTLKGDTGARKILGHHKNDLISINFEDGVNDIDTIADYENLLKTK